MRGDLTLEDVDALVNAANEGLRGGGGVDGALHRAAGPELLAACTRLHPEGCPTGEVRVTPGFALRARWVIHAVGPVWSGGAAGEGELLAACHRNALRAAAELGARSLAFPAISCGVYRFPWERAARIALAAARAGLECHPSLVCVRFVLSSDEILRVFREAQAELADDGRAGGAASARRAQA